tara:strand:+ start:59 stop:1231 length:1173 start_codon:yes stop_codon:yes gene_type:complete
LKILFIQCFDKPGGQSNRSYLFAKKLDKIGRDVHFFTNRYNHLDAHAKYTAELNKDNNIKHIFAENDYFKNNKYLSVIFNCFAIIKTLRKEHFDIIIGPSVPLLNSFFALIAKNKKTKFIFEIRDVWPDALVFNGTISKLNPIYIILKIIEIIIYKNADGLISVLPKTFNYVRKYNKELPQIYLPNCYDSYPRYKKIFNKDKLKIIYIGRFNSNHDIEIILKSAQYLLYEKNIKNITFDIYGYGEKLDLIKKYKYDNKIINLNLKGKISKNDIYTVSKKYDLALCAITNSKSHQWGTNLNKIYEYLNSSLPVIFSGNVPSNPVTMARCGFVCDNFNYKDLSNKIIMFSKLKENEKIKLSNNAKDFFDTNYYIEHQIALLNKFIYKICSSN